MLPDHSLSHWHWEGAPEGGGWRVDKEIQLSGQKEQWLGLTQGLILLCPTPLLQHLERAPPQRHLKGI